MRAGPPPLWPLYLVRRYPGRAIGFELVGPVGTAGVMPLMESERWHRTAARAVASARKQLRRTGGRIWVFKPDGRFYREVFVRG